MEGSWNYSYHHAMHAHHHLQPTPLDTSRSGASVVDAKSAAGELFYSFFFFFLNSTVLSFVTQNSTRPPLKLSNVERITNFQILVLFGCLLAISLVCSIGQTIWKYQYGNDAWYMDLNCKSPSSPR